jgi:hypothetical protein
MGWPASCMPQQNVLGQHASSQPCFTRRVLHYKSYTLPLVLSWADWMHASSSCTTNAAYLLAEPPLCVLLAVPLDDPICSKVLPVNTQP